MKETTDNIFNAGVLAGLGDALAIVHRYPDDPIRYLTEALKAATNNIHVSTGETCDD